MSKVLLIIGNGFDLHCGLNSRYSDFFKYLLENNINFQNAFKSIEKIYYNHLFEGEISEKEMFDNKHNLDLRRINVSIWEIYFICNYISNQNIEYKNWADIEKEISNVLINSNENVFFSTFESSRLFYNTRKRILSDTRYQLFNAILIKYFVHIRKYDDEITKCFNLSSFYYWLLKQLKIFEKLFNDYIFSSQNESYYKEANSFLEEFYNKNIILNRFTNEKTLSIINFNYTKLEFDNAINVHGVAYKENQKLFLVLMIMICLTKKIIIKT